MFDRVELKERAKEYIRTDLKKIAIIGVLISLVSGTIGAMYIPTAVLTALGIVSSILTVGVCKFCLNKIQGKEANLEDLTFCFTVIPKAIIISILIGLGTVIGSMLLFVPGIIFAIMSTFSFWVLAENPEMGPVECIKESMRLTKGAKMEILIANLSFLGWYVVTALTFGFANILVAPYSSLTFGQIYLTLKNQKDGYSKEDYKINDNFDLL